MGTDERATEESVSVCIIGAGFSGIAAAVDLRRRGIDDFVLLDRAAAPGGVWRDNTYPGCRCDVPSVLYSFSFAPKPDWSDHFATQPEIWQYLQDCVDTFGLRANLRLSTDAEQVTWQPDTGHWSITTRTGRILARMLVVATGALNEPAIPTIPGLADFTGELFHSAEWPADFSPQGKRVAVIGTGASAIQFVPQIASDVASMTVYQRTPPWVLPRGDHRISNRRIDLYRRAPATQRAVRTAEYLRREAMSGTFVNSGQALSLVERIGRKHLRAQVPDPQLRALMTPSYRAGCKRILLSDDWYPTLDRSNVRLSTEPIEAADSTGLISTNPATGGHRHSQFDAIIMATGFRVTRLPFPSRIRGASGGSLAQSFGKTRASAYLGSTVTGFPNLVLMTGPNTGLANTSMVLMIEAQAHYAGLMAEFLTAHPRLSLDLRPGVLAAWTADLDERLKKTVWQSGGCASWYQDARGRVTTLWPGRTSRFRHLTDKLNLADYRVITAPKDRPNRSAATAG